MAPTTTQLERTSKPRPRPNPEASLPTPPHTPPKVSTSHSSLCSCLPKTFHLSQEPKSPKKTKSTPSPKDKLFIPPDKYLPALLQEQRVAKTRSPSATAPMAGLEDSSFSILRRSYCSRASVNAVMKETTGSWSSPEYATDLDNHPHHLEIIVLKDQVHLFPSFSKNNLY